MTTHNVSASSTPLFSQTVTWAIKTLHGREVAESDGHSKAMEWVKTYCADSEKDNPTEDEFRASLAEAPRLTTKETLFRFRPWGECEPPSPQDMGPPSNRNASAGRYNDEGQAALYLCSSDKGCHCERESIKEDKRPYYIQQFEIDFSKLNIADTTALPDTNLVNHAFLFSERCKFAEGYPDNYLFCQNLASIIAEVGFEGMKVFGVRNNGTEYANFVIFKPNDRPWTGWLRGEPAGPFNMGATS